MTKKEMIRKNRGKSLGRLDYFGLQILYSMHLDGL